MLAILSPAKSLDFGSQRLTGKKSTPAFLDDSEELIERLRSLTVEGIAELMGISRKLAELNYERFQVWRRPYPKGGAKQALLAFTGDVYQGFELERFKETDWAFAQDHLRILSGLYGLLRPLDLILPYRLEMGTSLKTARGKDLYAFWGDKITEALNRALKKQGDAILVNLASNEYYGAVRPARLEATVITPVFKDWKNGKLKVISFYAKRARGMMADYLIRSGLTELEDLKGFERAGYGFESGGSTETEWVFTRAER